MKTGIITALLALHLTGILFKIREGSSTTLSDRVLVLTRRESDQHSTWKELLVLLIPFFFFDVEFMMGEMHNETRNERDKRQGMNSMLPRSMPANGINCETSSGHFVMRFGFRKILSTVARRTNGRSCHPDVENTCGWSHIYDESE